MDAAGALETLLPQLHPAELWQRSGRWSGYTAGEGIMFHLQDRQDRELGLGPTCLLYTSPSPRDATLSRMPSSA